jgi:antitoxin component YwqK of YwqJK toxin-antitoxin module
MKNIIFIITFITFITSSCSKRSIVLTEDTLPEDIFFLESELKPYTGKCTIYYINTEIIKDVICFKNGILNGEHKSYYKNGQLKRQGSYVNGNLNGKWIGYEIDGRKIYEVEYKNDTLVGRFFTWYSTGVIREKGSFRNNRKVDEWVLYDEAGMIISKTIL